MEIKSYKCSDCGEHHLQMDLHATCTHSEEGTHNYEPLDIHQTITELKFQHAQVLPEQIRWYEYLRDNPIGDTKGDDKYFRYFTNYFHFRNSLLVEKNKNI